VRIWIGTERGEHGQTKLTFVWEPVPNRSGDASRMSESPSRVTLSTTGATANPYFRGPVPASTLSPRPLPPGSGAPTGGAVSFDVQPGLLLLKMTVEGSAAEILDAETLEFKIPDFMTPQVSLSTPKVFRVRTPGKLLQIKGDPQAVPSAAREFSRSDRLLMRVAGYGPGDVPPTLTARLLDRTGQSISENCA